MNSTKREVLDFFRKYNSSATVADVNNAVGYSNETIRKTIKQLVMSGDLEHSGFRSINGNNATLYALVKRVQKKSRIDTLIDEGRAAADMGVSISSCPYGQADGAKKYAWIAGFHDRCAELQ